MSLADSTSCQSRLGSMDFSIKSGRSVVYIEGSHVIISKKKYYISFSSDR